MKTQIYRFKSFAALLPKLCLLILILFTFSMPANGQIADDFSDGDFNNNPTWSGDVGSFKINTSKELQLNGVAADTSYLSTPNTSINNTEWDIWLKISLAPTAGNNERIYLVSDQANLKGSLNGYFIYLGANKNIAMIKQTGNVTVNIFTGIAQHVNKTVNSIGLKITRDSLGLWTIYSDTTGGINYIPEGNPFMDSTFTTTNYFGVVCQYTVSNATKFYFDNIYVGGIKTNALPSLIPDSFDIVVNEIMYDPISGGSDFVELYNRSDKTFDLKDISIANVGFTSGIVMDTVPITGTSRLFLPGEYIVLTASIANVLFQYPKSIPNSFIELPVMPQFYADSGGVAIISSNKIIDQFQYSNAMQFPMLNDLHDVSLERLNFDRMTQDNTNWHSASEGVGFGTPGYKNSQFESNESVQNNFYLEPEIFSPDNNAYEDVVNLHYHFKTAGNVGTITIFDAKGRLVRNLVSNELLGTDGAYSWDGINNQNTKAGVGIYVAYLSVFDLKGVTNSFKKTCVLAANL